MFNFHRDKFNQMYKVSEASTVWNKISFTSTLSPLCRVLYAIIIIIRREEKSIKDYHYFSITKYCWVQRSLIPFYVILQLIEYSLIGGRFSSTNL